MTKYKLVIFDVDGTLLDTTEGLLESVNFIIEKFSLKTLTHEQLLTFIGPPIHNSLKRYYDNLTSEEIQNMADEFRAYYKERALYKAAPYPYIYELLDAIKNNGIEIAVATYKRQDYAVDILKHFGFDQYTDILYGSDSNNKMTKRDIMLKCVETAGIHSMNEVVMVGDSDNDAIGAQNLGMDFIGVTYGFGFKTVEDIQKFQWVGIAKDAMEILKYIT